MCKQESVFVLFDSDVLIQRQFFQDIDLCGFEGEVTVKGLASVALRDPIKEAVGPISNLYATLHTLGQKFPIPDLNETVVRLPAYLQPDLLAEHGLAGNTKPETLNPKP
jgi:hypothetical protein